MHSKCPNMLHAGPCFCRDRGREFRKAMREAHERGKRLAETIKKNRIGNGSE